MKDDCLLWYSQFVLMVICVGDSENFSIHAHIHSVEMPSVKALMGELTKLHAVGYVDNLPN